MKRIFISIIATGLCAAAAMAIPAKPGLMSFTQPDGSIVNVTVIGDEHGHMIYSENGHLLLESNGRLEYAAFDSEGFPKPSGIMANAHNERLSAASNIQSINQIDSWAERLSSNKMARLEKQRSASMMRMKSTRSEENDIEDDDNRFVPKYFGRCNSTFPVTGVQKGLVILVEYQDVEFKYGDFDYFNRMLNEEGFSDFGSLGSARDWFIENSEGKFLPDFDVYGPVKLPNDRVYYGGNDAYGSDKNAHEMVLHACQILDDDVDFSQYDRDGDGLIDNVFIFYAGKGEHDSNIANTVWPHSWDFSAAIPDEQFFFDGVMLEHYACTCEYPSGYNRPDGIGTFVHEFSHVIGLPDLYVTTYSSGFTPGVWDALDKGPYNNDRLTPPNYSSFEKCALGWMDLLPFTEGKMELPDLSENNIAFALPTDNPDEFYFFENRQQRGNDEFLPGHGMLVWHIDYKENVWAANAVNNLSTHQYVDIVEADNIKSDSTRAGDAFPGTKNVTSLGFDTKPKLASWAKKRLQFDLSDIAESEDGMITFNAVANETDWGNSVESIGAESDSNQYYDLMGRKITNPGKGIYILNGKKVIR